MWKTYQFKVSVKDDNYDAWKTANIRIMTPVKPQISKFKAEKSCQVGFNVLWQLYSWASIKRVKSSVHVSVSSVCIQWLRIILVVWSYVLKRKHKGFSSCTWGKTEVSLFCHLNYWASVARYIVGLYTGPVLDGSWPILPCNCGSL